MATDYVATPKQIIEGQNLSQQKLLSLLKNVYGTSNEGEYNFRVEVRYRPPAEQQQ
jgi:hypothetical protein